MSCRNVIAVLVAAGLLAGCDTYNAIRRDIGIDPRDPPVQQAAAPKTPQQPMPSAPPAPVMQGGVAQANWAAQRAATASASNQGNTAPVGYTEPEKPAESAVAAPAATAAMPAASPAPTRTARAAPQQPAGNAAANRTAAAPAAVAAPGLPAGYKPSPSVMDNPAQAMEQQKMAAATGAIPEPPKMAGSMKEPGSVTGGSWRVHLASHRTESAAINEWQELLKANPQLYGQYDPLVSWVELQGRGSFARLELVGFPDRKAAEAACAKLRTGTRYCAAVAE
ncbi:MAG: SPOR domain-containing protein [Ferrovibrio sp.]|uniref:SPOR domain-containing protein n=1 Tax=Ferrovibrio sp. TaxID=1917215 RepID=UPI00391A72A0